MPNPRWPPASASVDVSPAAEYTTMAIRFACSVNPEMARRMREHMQREMEMMQRELMEGRMGGELYSNHDRERERARHEAMLQAHFMPTGLAQQANTATQAAKKMPNKKLLLCEV